MTDKAKNLVQVILLGGLLLVFFLWCILKPTTAVSDAERRQLASFPRLSVQSLTSGDFMHKFEDYAMDQFPLRDGFRAIKAGTVLYLFRQNDKNGVFLADEHISRLEYPLDDDSVDNAAQRFKHIYDMYLNRDDVSVFLSVIPDKNYYIDTLKLDYAKLSRHLSQALPFAESINLFDVLSLDDYYRTDIHWRQERLIAAADRLAAALGVKLTGDYRINQAQPPFRGVYYGQSALPLAAEALFYLTSPTLDACTVYDYETDREISVYNQDALTDRDPYEFFLYGSKSLLKITNPNATGNRRLILFRDSFGSSIAPLLAGAYSEIVLVDIRYIATERLASLIDFSGADVLFLYSTPVLNNSVTLK